MKRYQAVPQKARPALDLSQPLEHLIEEVDNRIEELASDAGRSIMQLVMDAEVTRRAGGARFEHNPRREGHRWGAQTGYVVFGGRKLPLERPRMRDAKGREVELDSYRRFQSSDKLGRQVKDRVLLGLSSRNYEHALWDVVDGYGVSRSSVSRHVVRATHNALKKLCERDLSKLDLVALVIDGKRFADQMIVVVLGVDAKGAKHVLGLWQGATENTTICQQLLEDLIRRGLDPTRRYLVVIDGSKALRKAIGQVLGDNAVVQRCQCHKRRNVREHLPQARQAEFDRKLSAAYAATDYGEARRALESTARELDRVNPSAAASLREGLDETLSLHRLGLPEALRKSFTTTNLIESCFSVAEDLTRNVKRWRPGKMTARWAATCMLEAEKKFRKVRGYRQMAALVAALSEAVPAGGNTGVDEVKRAA